MRRSLRLACLAMVCVAAWGCGGESGGGDPGSLADATDLPAGPDLPDPADAPDPRDAPDPLDLPDAPGVPDAADLAEVDGPPDAADVPDDADAPDDPGTPEVTDVPGLPDIPILPDAPDVPDVPEPPVCASLAEGDPCGPASFCRSGECRCEGRRGLPEAPLLFPSSKPASVAGGDLDGDGRPDLAVADGPAVRVLAGEGDGTFTGLPDLEVPEDVEQVLLADIDRDGALDVIARSWTAVRIFPGAGDGTFGTATTLAIGSYSHGMAVGDFDGAGDPDLAVAALDGTRGVLQVFHGAGDGTFPRRDPWYADGGETARFFDVAAGDMDGDGRDDVALLYGDGAWPQTVRTWLGRQDGGFEWKNFRDVSTSAYSVDIVDYDGDGRRDIIVAESLQLRLMAGLGSGFTLETSLPLTVPSLALALGDVDGDGRVDLVIANSLGAPGITVMKNAGAGAFTPGGSWLAGPTPGRAAVLDLDGDGDADLALPHRWGFGLAVLRNLGDGTFPGPLALPAADNANALAAGDLDGDGRPEVVAALDNGTVVGWKCVPGPDCRPGSTLSVGLQPRTLAVADLDADGDLDLVAGGWDPSAPVTVLKTGPNGTVTSATYGSFRVDALAVGDVTGDAVPDLVTADQEADEVRVLPGNGDATFGAETRLAAGDTPFRLAIADVTGDGRNDLLVIHFVAGTLGLHRGQSDGTLAARIDHAVGGTGAPVALKVADLDGDGAPEVLVLTNRDADRTATVVVLRPAEGGFVEAASIPMAGAGWTLTLADLTGDDVPDLATLDSNRGLLAVRPGAADGTFGALELFLTGALPGSVAAGDFDGDGRVDLAVGHLVDPVVSFHANACVP